MRGPHIRLLAAFIVALTAMAAPARADNDKPPTAKPKKPNLKLVK